MKTENKAFCKTKLFIASINLLSAYHKAFSALRLQMHFSSAQKVSKLDIFFTVSDMKGTLKGLNYSAADTFFLLIRCISQQFDRIY